MQNIELSSVPSCTLSVNSSIEQLQDDWRTISKGNVYADPDYLKLLEENGPYNYKYFYALIYRESKPIMAIYFQYKRIELSRDFRVHTHSSNFFKKLNVRLMRCFLRLINQNLLICGNVLLTGEYAYGALPEFNPSSEFFQEILRYVKKELRNELGQKVQGILCKDFFKQGPHKKLQFDAPGFTRFEVQPAMIMQMDSEWKSFDDYLGAVRSKYRVKYKKVLKKAKSLQFRELQLSEVHHYNKKMYNFYKGTSERADFSLFRLHPQYFYELKKCLAEKIIITGIFKEDELLGFYTFVQNGAQGDAHFIGYDISLNSKYQLYFNILLGLVRKSIDSKSQYLNLSRTALEIKSSVGAEAHDMFIYLRHENPMVNLILPIVLKYIVPKNEWQPRSPFKEDE